SSVTRRPSTSTQRTLTFVKAPPSAVRTVASVASCCAVEERVTPAAGWDAKRLPEGAKAPTMDMKSPTRMTRTFCSMLPPPSRAPFSAWEGMSGPLSLPGETSLARPCSEAEGAPGAIRGRAGPSRVADEDSIQESLEQSAKISSVVFNAPPTILTYAYVLVASGLLGLILEPSLHGAFLGLMLLGVRALAAGPASAPLANALGGTLYYKRAAFIAAVAMSLVGLALLVSLPLRALWAIPIAHVLLVGYWMGTSFRHTALWITSDNRHWRTFLVAALQVAVAVGML